MISDEHIQSVNDLKDNDPALIAAVATTYTAADWLEAINDNRLTVAGKSNLVKVCQDRTEMIPVLVRLASQYGFGLSIAREITTEANWKTLNALLAKHHFPAASSIKDKQRAIASLLVDGALFKYVFRILLSKAVIGAVGSLIRDREYEVRIQALTRLARHDCAETKEALITALEDSHEKVREHAKQVMYMKYPKEVSDEIFHEQEAEASDLRTLAEGAYQSLTKGVTSSPAWAAAVRAATTVKQGAATAVDATRSTLRRGLRLFFGEEEATSDQKNEIFALQLAIVWADGVVDDEEMSWLRSVANAHTIDESLMQYLDRQPTLTELAPYIKRLKSPEQHLRKAIDWLPTGCDALSNPYYDSLGSILGIELSSFAGAKS